MIGSQNCGARCRGCYCKCPVHLQLTLSCQVLLCGSFVQVFFLGTVVDSNIKFCKSRGGASAGDVLITLYCKSSDIIVYLGGSF